MSLPNPSLSFSPFAILTAEELNDMVENIEALADGSGLDDGSVTASKLDSTTFVWQNWTPSFTGFSSDPTGVVARYFLLGKTCYIFIRIANNGTSNANSFTMTLPFTAATITNASWNTLVQVIDNSVVGGPGLAQIASAATVVSFNPSLTSGSWTASGGKRVASCELFYEVA